MKSSNRTSIEPSGGTTSRSRTNAVLLQRFGDVLSRGLADRLNAAVSRGEVRPDVAAEDLVEAIAGITFLALITRGDALDEAWVERSAALITRGISA
jgi:hypothetical protein